LRDPNRYRITHRYIGNTALWTDIFSQLTVQEAAGGQMRRLGAALFEPQCQEFMDRVGRLCEDLHRKRTRGTCFHVCCGLAGGTGAGAFLHVIAQLRAAFDNANKNFPIYLYLLLPEPDSGWARNGLRTNYYANGYAALQELNAYLVPDPREGPNKGGPVFSPVDLTGKSERFENPSAGGRTRLLDRLQGCFVISNVNERSLVIGVENEENHGLVAQMIFQRIFLVDSAEAGKGQELRRAITLENELVEDEGLPKNPNVKVRSFRFLTFGLKRLIVPDEEIREHFSANFASQAALQMLYNNWRDDAHAAFLGEKKNETFKQFVREKETHRLWKISDQQITLSEGILPGEIANPKWRSIDQDWEMITPHLKKDAWSLPRDDRRDARLDDLYKAFQGHYGNTFRGVGVEKFYEAAARDLRLPDRYISEICETLEKWTFQEWSDGRAVSDIDVLLDDLGEDLHKRLDEIRTRLVTLESQVAGAEEKLARNKQAWARVGLLGRAFGKPAKLFDAQAGVLEDLYRKRTWIHANQFAEKLLKGLIPALRDRMRPSVGAFRAGLSEINEFFQKRVAQTCQDPVGDRAESHVINFHDPDKARRFCRSLLEAEQQQRVWAGALRQEAVKTAEENTRRVSGREKYVEMMVNQFLKKPDAKRVVEAVSTQNADQAHNDKTGSLNRQFGVNIVSKLAEEYATDREKLNGFIKVLVRSALTFMQWREAEFSSATGPAAPLAVFAVVLPKCEEHAPFRAELQNASKEAVGSTRFEIIDSGRKLNEICLIAFKYVFPLRWLQPAWYLKERYDYRLSQGLRDRALLEVHIEDHDPDLPSLFQPAPAEPGKEILPWLLIAGTLNLFEKKRSTATGEWESLLLLRTDKGLPDPHYYPHALIALTELPAQPPKDASVLKGLLDRITEKQLEVAELKSHLGLSRLGCMRTVLSSSKARILDATDAHAS